MIDAHHRRPSACAILCGAIALTIGTPAPGPATTMGFTRQFHFPPTSGPNLHWISLPWNYQPEDFGTPDSVDAEDLCQDLGGEATIAAVLRWDEPSSTLVEHTCGSGSPFALSVGIGYAIRNVPEQTILGALAGAHDDAFTYSIPPSGDGQFAWLSVPYHLRIPQNGGDLRVTAEDLCRQIGSSEVLAIVRWDEPTGAYRAYGCGSVFETPFELVRGEAYGVVNRSGATIDWQPIHF